MHPLATDLNQIIRSGNPHILEMLSELGRSLFFPKGILSQSAEAKQKATHINATIGIALENGRTMQLDSVMKPLGDITAADALTYAPSFGLKALREAWQAGLFEKNRSLTGKSISLPVVTCGITHAVSTFAELWLDPGDTVVLPDLFWGNYNLILALRRGARLIHYPFFTPEGGFNHAGFEDSVARTAAEHGKVSVVLNFPNNPTGYTITAREADRIAAFLTATAEKGANVVAAFDDAYFGLFYGDAPIRESLFARLCSAHPRLMAVKMDGATKENFAWGLRVGFITYGTCINGDSRPVYEALEKKTAGCIRGCISNASHLSQSLLLRSLQSPEYPVEKQAKTRILEQRAGRVKAVLNDPKYRPAWSAYPFNSGYFMCLRLKTVDAETLRCHLLERYGVGLIAVDARNLRVAFSCLEERDVAELFDTVLKAVRELEHPTG
jgi:aspartate/methionine/tyrosine aminotransferase